jgi:hypothetical protein
MSGAASCERCLCLVDLYSYFFSHDLKLKGSKCEMFKTSGSYLGHVISENCISTDPEKTFTISSWPEHC